MNARFPQIETGRVELVDFLSQHERLCLLYDSVGNVGDLLIKEGTRALLDSAGLRYQIITSIDEVADASSMTLLVRGSGGWCQHFHGFMPDLVMRAAAKFGTVLVLPSNYESSAPGVRAALSADNVVALSRDLRSATDISSFARGFASVDCAVYHPRLAAGHSSPGSGNLVVLREDKASPLTDQGMRPNPAVNEDISSTAASLDDWLDRIEAAETVITDRLHVAVAAALLRRELVLIDPYAQKLSTYFSYTFGASLEPLAWRDVDWLYRVGLTVPSATWVVDPETEVRTSVLRIR